LKDGRGLFVAERAVGGIVFICAKKVLQLQDCLAREIVVTVLAQQYFGEASLAIETAHVVALGKAEAALKMHVSRKFLIF